MKTYFIDTNIILRFITGSPEVQARKVAAFLEKSDHGQIKIYISSMIIAEVVFVLTGKVYSYPKKSVADALKDFLSNPSFIVPELDVIVLALSYFVSFYMFRTKARRR